MRREDFCQVKKGPHHNPCGKPAVVWYLLTEPVIGNLEKPWITGRCDDHRLDALVAARRNGDWPHWASASSGVTVLTREEADVFEVMGC